MSKAKKVWKIAIREKKDKSDFFITLDDYTFNIQEMPKRYWAADPFLFSHNGIDYLFYEIYDKYRTRGLIGYSVITNGKISLPNIIINCKYHLSYPYVFEYEGDIYIMPESCGDHSIQLFKAVRFPDKWEKSDILVSNIEACDSVFLHDDDNHYLLTSIMPDGDYCCVQNVLYPINAELQVDTSHPFFLGKGDYGERNGGKILLNGNKTIRVGQDCTDHEYGKGLVFFEVEGILPYKEKELFRCTVNDIKNHLDGRVSDLCGVHTYNSNNKYEVIDILISGNEDTYITVFAFLHRCYKFLIRKIKTIIK